MNPPSNERVKCAIQFVGKDSKLLFTAVVQFEDPMSGDYLYAATGLKSGTPDVLAYTTYEELHRRGLDVPSIDDIYYTNLAKIKEVRGEYINEEGFEPADINALLGLVHNYTITNGECEILFVFWTETRGEYHEKFPLPRNTDIMHPDADIALMFYQLVCGLCKFLFKFGLIAAGIVASFYVLHAIIGVVVQWLK